MKLVRIEPGTFTMGQEGPPIAGNGNMATHHAEFRSADWDERPAHRVTITQPFYMGSTEVTLGQFRRFDPDFRKGKGADDDAEQAITWTKAVAFCDWLSKKEGKLRAGLDFLTEKPKLRASWDKA
jgi:formylglycine-generating enzyme required for sulfatase activity